MDIFEMKSAPALREQTYTYKNMRVSVITEKIIRIEKYDDNKFIDNATQMVICRNFCNTDVSFTNDDKYIKVNTDNYSYRIDFTNLKTEVLENNKWISPSNKTNLGGTARTLDGTFGVLGSWKTKKEYKDHFCFEHMRKGIFSSNGIAEIDDSNSFLFNEDGSINLRNNKGTDKYIFYFGDDYLGGLKEFSLLCGKTPLLPKYALGNWWSRYYAYTQDEYLNLIKRFSDENIPFTVATIDMDWHIVKNVPKDVKPTIIQGAGWTGYTFEKELFPDYKAFLKELKNSNLAVTMNLHPGDGCRYYETQYNDMCAACNQNPEEKKPVKFNLTDKTFTKAYFDILHHPYENDGVDFWWIDWQQGTSSKDMLGLDPLWLLNHYHFIDNNRDKNDGIILSRYAGIGSHRYPIGFSGDTFVCWKSLDFQPWFTANASNVGYTWWSHDIGGHMWNKGDCELYLRWLQLGVFSPINRLHSNNKSISKEPWNFKDVEETAKEYLRLRHRLIPYIYSCNVKTSSDGIPLICPMYYYDKSDKAYSRKYKNQYWFGPELIVAPVTQKSVKGKPNCRFYLPEGKWTDIFTGKEYSAGEYEIYCELENYPVFAKSGAIIPKLTAKDSNDYSFDSLEIDIYKGNGDFTVYDSENEYIKIKATNGKIEITKSVDTHINELIINYIGTDKPAETIKI